MASKTSDFAVGDRFGLLTVVDGPYKGRDAANKPRFYYLVECDCGEQKWLNKSSILVAVSCGCQNVQKADLTNRRFGHLLVIEEAERDSRNRIQWLCVCDCGNTSTVRGDSLRGGLTESCGCITKEGDCNVRHGFARSYKTPDQYRSRTYNIWAGLKARSLNLNHRDAHNYCGRGITVCERWLKFENFLEDMGECPEGLTIDRYPDPNGNYEPGNTRWATPKQQANNTRRTHKFQHQGRSVTISDLVEISGKNHHTLYERLVKKRMSVEEAIAA